MKSQNSQIQPGQGISPLTRQLNPSEIEELKEDLYQTLDQAKGRSRHLKKYENRLGKHRKPFTTTTGNGN